MKKIYISLLLLFLIVASHSSKAQNFVINPGMETWTSDTQPEGYTIAENITKDASVVHGGSFSAKHTSASSTKKIQQVIEGITAGETYTIEYWFFDNDNAAKSRIWSYWLNGTTTIAADEAILRPATYSENSAQWQLFSAVLTAPAEATAFRFEVRAYNQDGNNGGAVYYDDFTFSGDIVIKPEPTNYPTAFEATVSGLGVNLSWIDATGEQLPDAYLIYGTKLITKEIAELPVDGIPIANNLDIGEGYIAWNVSYGEEAFNFNVLESGATYLFQIFPYTNTGENINYKTGGTVPEATFQTNNYQILLHETFDADLGVMDAYSVTGEQEWTYYNFNNEDYARISGYSGGAVANEDWLISPALVIPVTLTDITLSFRSARNYDGNTLQLYKSTDYNGTGNPNNFSWTEITDQADWSVGTWTWVQSGDVLIAEAGGSTYYIAIKYTSTTEAAATWQIDDILVYGSSSVGLNEKDDASIVLFPNPASDYVRFTTTDQAVIIITDITGRIVLKEQVAGGQNQISVNHLQKGLYLVQIEQNDKTQHLNKLVIK
ncbi:MAG: hypothetical protein FD155_986 [Bacteroidetes bacterium]|nr:MAG: hypothetical protein FD155_986 [Bacteroidota bacterium]